jgi:hypothetical protein
MVAPHTDAVPETFQLKHRDTHHNVGQMYVGLQTGKCHSLWQIAAHP